MKSIASKIITGLAIVIFLIAIGIMIAGTIAIRRNEPVFVMGYALAVVPTESMIGDQEDSLDINDLVIIKKTAVTDIDVDNHPVIVYQGIANDGSNILIIHRVVGENSQGLITQGDNRTTNPETDQENGTLQQAYITSDNYQGVYATKITFLKPIANIMTDSRSAIFAVIVVILALILITELVHLMKTINEKKKQKMASEHEAYIALMKDTHRQAIKDEIKKEYMANLEQSKDAKL